MRLYMRNLLVISLNHLILNSNNLIPYHTIKMREMGIIVLERPFMMDNMNKHRQTMIVLRFSASIKKNGKNLTSQISLIGFKI